LKRIEARIRSINPNVPIFRTQYSNIHPEKLLKLDAFNLARFLETDPEFLNTDGEHVHDESVSSVAWRFSGLELNVTKLQEWISKLTQELGQELFRYKGVLAVKGMKKKYAFQGVHMMFAGDFIDTEWKEDEERDCRFVVIGKNIRQQHSDRLQKEFLECKAEEELRFKVGDAVMANTENGWRHAKVLTTWEEGHPYRLELQYFTKTQVWGVVDTDDYVTHPESEGFMGCSLCLLGVCWIVLFFFVDFRVFGTFSFGLACFLIFTHCAEAF